jgi:hypothetical protein
MSLRSTISSSRTGGVVEIEDEDAFFSSKRGGTNSATIKLMMGMIPSPCFENSKALLSERTEERRKKRKREEEGKAMSDVRQGWRRMFSGGKNVSYHWKKQM